MMWMLSVSQKLMCREAMELLRGEADRRKLDHWSHAFEEDIVTLVSSLLLFFLGRDCVN